MNSSQTIQILTDDDDNSEAIIISPNNNKNNLNLTTKFLRDRERNQREAYSKDKKLFERCKIGISLNYFLKKFEDIKIIDGKNFPLFERVINLIKYEKQIAIDTEHFKEPSNKLKTSTLQISTPHEIFIFDMVSIMDLSDWEIYIIKLDNILKCDGILKLAYEPIQDFKILNYTAKYKYFSVISRIIDLAEIKNEFLEKIVKIKIKGLQGFVKYIFGMNLDKEEQTSDWLKRPLTINQIEYAALDSFILFKLYMKINLMHTIKFYDYIKVYELKFIYPSSKTNVVQSKFRANQKNETLIVIE